jgi:hypothetical protein
LGGVCAVSVSTCPQAWPQIFEFKGLLVLAKEVSVNPKWKGIKTMEPCKCAAGGGYGHTCSDIGVRVFRQSRMELEKYLAFHEHLSQPGQVC